MVGFIRLPKPREGWGVFLLWLATVMALPAAALAAEWVPRDEGLLVVALLALLVGYWLSSREDWGWSIWLPVGGALGLLASLAAAGHTFLFVPGGARMGFDFARRWVQWLRIAFTGGRSQDPDVFLFYVSLLCWVTVLFSAWALRRRRVPFSAVSVPLLVAVVSVFFSKRGVPWVVAGLGCGVLLIAIVHLRYSELEWERAGIDYAVDLLGNVIGAALGIAVLVMAVSYAGPLATAQNISDWFRRTFREPTEEVEDTAERLFGGVRPPEGGIPRLASASSSLPQNRLLGGEPELLSEVVLIARTDEPPPSPEEFYPLHMRPSPEPQPPHYWQGLTFDYYTGSGWSVTVARREPVKDTVPFAPPPVYRRVEQHYELVAPHGETLYTLSNPYTVEQAVEALWRVPPYVPTGESPSPVLQDGTALEPDLAGLVSEVVSYTVVSLLPEPTAAALRATPAVYSAEIVSFYLQLPPTVPDRVIDLARQVTEEGTTVYDKARLLESYLRQYPYSLKVDRPPAGRDVADYFLFEIREGYCDYYATAFVVMARAVGIPARLVTGYVGGQYSHELGAYLVHQYDGHSWPEVYFPGWGWIGFEPTAAQPVRRLPAEATRSVTALPGPVGPPASVVRSRWRTAGLAAAVIGIIMAGIGLKVRRLRQRSRQVVTLSLVWEWVGQAVARIGFRRDPALTPYEYVAGVTSLLREWVGETRFLQSHWRALAEQADLNLFALSTLYSAYMYGGNSAPAVDEHTVRDLWRRIRRPLSWFYWFSVVRRTLRLRPMLQRTAAAS